MTSRFVSAFLKRTRAGCAPQADNASGPAWSLRRRLLLVVMGTSAGLWLISMAIVIGVAWFTMSEVYDEALEEGARLVLQLGSQAGGSADPLPDGLRNARGEAVQLRMYYQLVGPDGQLLLRGAHTPKRPFLSSGPRMKGYANVRVDGELWRVHVRHGKNGISAQVAQPMEDRLELLGDMAESLAWPALVMLVVLGLLTWLLIRRLLRPLEETASRIAGKSPQDLTPVDAPGHPRELQPVVDALNALLLRLNAALDSERRFTADAAHELRTPLAALRMRVQLIERELGLPEAQLKRLRADVDRCTALVESLLALARLEPGAQPLTREPVELNALVDALDWSAAQARGMAVQRVLNVSHVHAAPTLLAAALRNLVDNAVRYGHDGGRIRVESTALPDGRVQLAVRDDGPGVSASERARLGERFFRVLGTQQTGSGLGLSIVARIAALHGGTMHFEDGIDGRGLGVVMELPHA